MMNRRIADSILSHKITQLSSRMESVSKGFSLSGTLFYFSSYLYERRITMKKSNSTKKAPSAFKKLGAVSLITATIFFTACNQTGGGKQKAPFVEGGAPLILSPDNLNIRVEAKTADGSAITVEGCEETTLKSDDYTELHATGTKVILKGNITELSCGSNKLAALNVQGLTALQWLWCYNNQLPELNVQGLTSLKMLGCYSNQLNAQAMIEILNALPAREASDYAVAELYTEETGEPEGNHKDYNTPAELKAAFEGAKKRNWKLQKYTANERYEDI